MSDAEGNLIILGECNEPLTLTIAITNITMTDVDKNRRIYECLREIYILTHNREEYWLLTSKVLGERSEPSNEEPSLEPSLDFDPMQINTLADFQTSPNLFIGRGPEEVILP